MLCISGAESSENLMQVHGSSHCGPSVQGRHDELQRALLGLRVPHMAVQPPARTDTFKQQTTYFDTKHWWTQMTCKLTHFYQRKARAPGEAHPDVFESPPARARASSLRLRTEEVEQPIAIPSSQPPGETP